MLLQRSVHSTQQNQTDPSTFNDKVHTLSSTPCHLSAGHNQNVMGEICQLVVIVFLLYWFLYLSNIILVKWTFTKVDHSDKGSYQFCKLQMKLRINWKLSGIAKPTPLTDVPPLPHPRIRMLAVATWAFKACLNIEGAKPYWSLSEPIWLREPKILSGQMCAPKYFRRADPALVSSTLKWPHSSLEPSVYGQVSNWSLVRTFWVCGCL